MHHLPTTTSPLEPPNLPPPPPSQSKLLFHPKPLYKAHQNKDPPTPGSCTSPLLLLPQSGAPRRRGGVAWTLLKALGESPCIQRNFFFFFSLKRNTGAASFQRCPFTGVRIQPPQPREMMVTCLYMPASYFAYIMRLLRTGSLYPALSISHHNVILLGCSSSFPFAWDLVYLRFLFYLFGFCCWFRFLKVLFIFFC